MHSNRFFAALALSLALVISGCGARQTSQAEADQKLADAQKQLEEAQKQVEEARSQAAAAQSQQAAPGSAATTPRAPGAPAAPATKSAWGDASKTASSKTPATPAAPKEITIPAGATVVVRTTTALSTKTAANGAPFAASLEKDLTVDGRLIAPKGAEVSGVVVSSDPGGKVKGLASIAVTLKSIATPSGPIRIDTDNRGFQAKSSVKKDVLKGGIMTGVGAAIGAIAGGGKGAAIGAGAGAAAGTGTAMMTHGDPAVIPAESVLTFKLTAPVTVPLK
jgi:hypothetical protein